MIWLWNVPGFKTFTPLRNWNGPCWCSWWFFMFLNCKPWITLRQSWRSEQLEWSALFCGLRVNCIFSVWRTLFCLFCWLHLDNAWWAGPRHEPSLSSVHWRLPVSVDDSFIRMATRLKYTRALPDSETDSDTYLGLSINRQTDSGKTTLTFYTALKGSVLADEVPSSGLSPNNERPTKWALATNCR